MSIDDMELAARLAYAAAANQSHRTRVCVVRILLNRVKKQGTTIKKELYRPNQFYEVESPMFKVSRKDKIFKECLVAVEEAVTSKIIPDSFLYFMNTDCKSHKMQAIKNKTEHISFDDLVFF